MTDLKISDLPDGGGLQAGDKIPVARSGATDRVTPIGVPVLVYRYTVVSTDKASIDTGVDTADAGSNNWTNGDLLEIYLTARTDETVVRSTVDFKLNNDGGSNYYRMYIQASPGSSATPSTAVTGAESAIFASVGGASNASNQPGFVRLSIPNYAGTVFNKTWEAAYGVSDPSATSGNSAMVSNIGTWVSTSAISRISVAPDTAAKKFKVGSQLLVYKRLSS